MAHARWVRVVALAVVLALEGGPLRVVLEHYLVLLAPLFSGLVVVLGGDKLVHPERPKHLLQPLEPVPGYVAFERV